MRIRHSGLIAVCGLMLSACASGAKPEAMAYTDVGTALRCDQHSPWHEAIAIGSVRGGEDTNPLWMSEVSDADFQSALATSLRAAACYDDQTPLYRLDAQLQSIDQPFVGIDMEVTAKIHYALTDIKTNESLWENTVTTPYTAEFSESWLGYERLRLANEGAIQKNIRGLLQSMQGQGIEQPPADPAAQAPVNTKPAAKPQS